MIPPEASELCPLCGIGTAGDGGICNNCGRVSTPQPAQSKNVYPPQIRSARQEVGSQIGRFRIVEWLGTGGFASVYRAEDTVLRRQVALKLLHIHLADNLSFVRRFSSEAQAAARLHHPHVVTLHDVGWTQDGRPYLVMELLHGRLLSQIAARQGRLPLERIATFVAQVSSALDYLHGQGMVHRDLKPANLMVDDDDHVTLLDFGIAHVSDEDVRLTLSGQVVGTPAYMAPEQIVSRPIRPQTDIYALGVITYELIGGRPPFTGKLTEVLHAHVYEPPFPLHNLRPGLRAELYQAVDRALAKDPDQRYASAGGFAAALTGEVADGEDDDTTPETEPEATMLLRVPAAAGSPADAVTEAAALPGTVPPVVPPAAPRAGRDLKQRNRLLIAAGAAFCCLVLVGAIVVVLLRSRTTGSPTTAQPSRPQGAAASVVAGSGFGGASVPSLRITGPSNGTTLTSPVTIAVETSGATIKPPDVGDSQSSHLHYFIDRDPAGVVKAGRSIPTGQADIIHTEATRETLTNLAPGKHTVWVVLSHVDHTPFAPNVEDKLTFTVVPAAGGVQTLAGSGRRGPADGAAGQAQFNLPSGLAVDTAGNLLVADTGNSRIRKIAPDGGVTTLAGAGSGQIDGPRGVAVDKSGTIYVADTNNNRIRKLTPDGAIVTLAGLTSPGIGGGGFADGQGSAAQFRLPVGIAVDGSGSVYVADSGNNSIRKISPDGTVTTLAGSGDSGAGGAGFADGAGKVARFNAPRGVAVDEAGNVYVADTLNQRIRKITPDGLVSTLAGSGEQGTSEGMGANARFSNPDGIAVDGAGNLYVADNASHRIRKITPSGTVTNFGGSGEAGYAEGTAAASKFDFPAGIAVDGAGNVFVADSNNQRVRKIAPFK